MFIVATIPPSFAAEVESYTTPGERVNSLDAFTSLMEVEQSLSVPLPKAAPPAPPSTEVTEAPKAEPKHDVKSETRTEAKTAPSTSPSTTTTTPSRVGESTPGAAGRTDLQASPVVGNVPQQVEYKDLTFGDLGNLKSLNRDLESVSARTKRIDKSMQSLDGVTAQALVRYPSQNPKLAALKEGQATAGLTADPTARAGFGDRGDPTFPKKPGDFKNPLVKNDAPPKGDPNADRGKTKAEKDKEKEEAEKKKEEAKKELDKAMNEMAETPTPYKREDYDKFRDFIASKQDDLKSAVEDGEDSKFVKTADTIFGMFGDLDKAAATKRSKDAYEAFLDNAKSGEPFRNPIVLEPTPSSHQGGPVHSPK